MRYPNYRCLLTQCRGTLVHDPKNGRFVCPDCQSTFDVVYTQRQYAVGAPSGGWNTAPAGGASKGAMIAGGLISIFLPVPGIGFLVAGYRKQAVAQLLLWILGLAVLIKMSLDLGFNISANLASLGSSDYLVAAAVLLITLVQNAWSFVGGIVILFIAAGRAR